MSVEKIYSFDNCKEISNSKECMNNYREYYLFK